MYNSSLTTQPATTGFDQIEWWNNLPDVWKKIFTVHLYHFDKIKSEENKIGLVQKYGCLEIAQQDIKQIFNLDKIVVRGSFLMDHNSPQYSREPLSLEPLSCLVNLKNIELKGCYISDISALSKLLGLEKLHLADNPISDISVLVKLTNLTDLNLSDCWGGIQISPISNLIRLTSLDLSSSGKYDTDFSFLSKLVNLNVLKLSNNTIEDVSFLSNLTNLSYLDLSVNNIRDISYLKKLTNLKHLNLDWNDLSYKNIGWLQGKLPSCDINFEDSNLDEIDEEYESEVLSFFDRLEMIYQTYKLLRK